MDIKKRELEFTAWVNNLEQRIETWKQQLPEELAEKLHIGSPRSLHYLEVFILKKYSSFNELHADSDFYDGVYSFLGETIRKSLDDSIWHIELRPEYKRHNFYNEPIILNKYLHPVEIRLSRAFGKDGHPDQNFKYMNQLFTYMKLRIKAKEASYYWRKIKGLPIEKVQIDIDASRSYEHFILLTKSNIELFEIASLLKSSFDNREQIKATYQFLNKDYFKLILQSGYAFHFQMDRSTHIEEESKDMANNHKGSLDKKLIAECKTRIEFWGDEDDMEYFNYAIWALQAFDDRSKFFVYDLQEGFLE